MHKKKLFCGFVAFRTIFASMSTQDYVIFFLQTVGILLVADSLNVFVVQRIGAPLFMTLLPWCVLSERYSCRCGCVHGIYHCHVFYQIFEFHFGNFRFNAFFLMSRFLASPYLWCLPTKLVLAPVAVRYRLIVSVELACCFRAKEPFPQLQGSDFCQKRATSSKCLSNCKH